MSNAILGVVDWDRDYKHCLKVNPSTHLDDVLKHFNKHSHKAFYINDINVVKIQKGKGAIKLNGYYSNFHIYNYILFRNDNNTNYYYAFIDSLDFEAERTTTINFTIDTWQMFSGSLSFKRSFIERMHIKKSDDTVGRWLAAEPLNPPKEYENVLSSVNTDFTPKYLVVAVSRPVIGQYDFEYGGQANEGVIANYSPYYGFKVDDIAGIHNLLKWYEPRPKTDLNFVDHRQDIVGCVLVPQFIYSQLGSSSNGEAPPDGQLPLPIAGSVNVSVDDTINLNPTTLACGYIPQNNKLFTSLCKRYILSNRNGLKIELLPELFTADNLLINFNGRGFDTQTIKMIVGNYRFYSKNTFALPYSATLPICYNQNDGVVKTLNTIKAVTNAVLNPRNILNNTEDVANSAFGSFGESVGSSSGEVLPLTNSYIRPRLIDTSPLYDQCREVDNYLTTYGYAIQEFAQPSISNRSNWNYIQGDINFSCNALEDNKQELKNIFRNGVTVWQNPLTMLDYSQENN